MNSCLGSIDFIMILPKFFDSADDPAKREYNGLPPLSEMVNARAHMFQVMWNSPTQIFDSNMASTMNN